MSREPIVQETHVWYGLDLIAGRPHPGLPAELVLRRGDEADAMHGGETISRDEALSRIRNGNDLWLVLENGRTLFKCWIFRGETPAVAAPGGVLALPAGTVCLEDSVTAAPARGRGIAPAAWASIADTLAAQDHRQIITKVGAWNMPSRRAVEKAGFRPVAIMRFIRVALGARTSLEVIDLTRGTFIADSLGITTASIVGPSLIRHLLLG